MLCFFYLTCELLNFYLTDNLVHLVLLNISIILLGEQFGIMEAFVT